MSRIDIAKSLLRSTARSAAAGLKRSSLAATLQRVLHEHALNQATITDVQLTKAVGRVAHIASVMVSTVSSGVRVDAHFEDGVHLSMAFRPAGLAFAAGGAKELAFTVEPASVARDQHCQDVLGAIVSEIARNLWKPVLMRAPHSDQAAIVIHDHDRLVVDLRSVPEVRWALGRSLSHAVIEAIRPRALETATGRITLPLKALF